MMQQELWNELIIPGITAIVGAGGKTTVLQHLVKYGLEKQRPMMVTTTTKMLMTQVDQWDPYVGTSFNEAEERVEKAIQNGLCGAWFSQTIDQQVDTVASTEVDAMSQLHPDWYIVVEADGARTKWLKVPKETEPVVPSLTHTTIGVMNLKALGKPITGDHVHNVALLLKRLNAQEGEILTPQMLARLVTMPEGIFQYSKGRKILFCTSCDRVEEKLLEEFLDILAPEDYHSIVLSEGTVEECVIRKVLKWKAE